MIRIWNINLFIISYMTTAAFTMKLLCTFLILLVLISGESYKAMCQDTNGRGYIQVNTCNIRQHLIISLAIMPIYISNANFTNSILKSFFLLQSVKYVQSGQYLQNGRSKSYNNKFSVGCECKEWQCINGNCVNHLGERICRGCR